MVSFSVHTHSEQTLQAVGVLVKSSAGKLRELCPSIDRSQIQDIITDVVGAALGGDSMPAKAFKKARCETVLLSTFELTPPPFLL